MPIDDVQSDLLRRAQQGDALAVEALLREVQPQLYRFSMKMCRHSADAEDVLQNSLMAMARTLRDFRGEASLSTWLWAYGLSARRLRDPLSLGLSADFQSP